MENFRKLQNEELHRISTAQFKEAKKLPAVIVLDNIRSQNNVGSVFRTSDAFRIEKIYLCGITSTPENREVHKTALGAEEAVEWEYRKETLPVIRQLKEEGYRILSVEQAEHSTSLEDFRPEPQEKYALVFGNEVKGVQQEVIDASDGCIEIPQFGTKHSFNIAVTVGIVLWQAIQPMLAKGKNLLGILLFFLLCWQTAPAQRKASSLTPWSPSIDRQIKQYQRQQRRDSIRAHKKVWMSILGGPSYSPEASLGIGGAMLMTFRMNAHDSISQRSFIPVGFNITLNGTFVAAGAGTLFFNENRFRIYIKYGYRREPVNFFGIGADEIKQAEKFRDLYGKDSVQFHKSTVQFYPRFVWEVRPHVYAGTLLDINYSRSKKMPYWMEQHPEIIKYGTHYHNIGVGALLQYDTRDDVATPYSGVFLNAVGTVYGKYLGGKFNYETVEAEYRQFQQLFRRRSTLAWTAKTHIGFGDVPYTELPTFGNPFDLRGYLWGKYRDKSIAYGIVEYRHMFMSQEAYERGRFWSKFGVAGWGGTGTLGHTPADWKTWKLNYGFGLRIQLQPRKNFRLDIGKEPGQKWGIYMNITEAF